MDTIPYQKTMMDDLSISKKATSSVIDEFIAHEIEGIPYQNKATTDNLTSKKIISSVLDNSRMSEMDSIQYQRSLTNEDLLISNSEMDSIPYQSTVNSNKETSCVEYNSEMDSIPYQSTVNNDLLNNTSLIWPSGVEKGRMSNNTKIDNKISGSCMSVRNPNNLTLLDSSRISESSNGLLQEDNRDPYEILLGIHDNDENHETSSMKGKTFKNGTDDVKRNTRKP